jgi:hypothetical protein
MTPLTRPCHQKTPNAADRAERLYLAAERLLRRAVALRDMGCVLISTAARLDETLGKVTGNLYEGFEEHGYYAYDWYEKESAHQIKEAILRVEEAWGDLWGRTVADPEKLERCTKQLDALLHAIDD